MYIYLFIYLCIFSNSPQSEKFIDHKRKVIEDFSALLPMIEKEHCSEIFMRT